MDQNQNALTDEELMTVADDPALRAKLTPDEMGRLSVLRAAKSERSGGPVARFVENAIQPLAQAPEMLLKMGQGLMPTEAGSKAREELVRGVTDPMVERLQMAAQAHREGRPAAALGNAAAAFPVIGPAVAHGIDQMREGDIAGGAGTLTGVAAPFVAGPLARGGVAALRGTTIGEGLADMADASANRRMVDTIVPKVGANKVRLGNQATEIAPQLLREPGLSAYSRSGLADKISANLDSAIEGLDRAADNRGITGQVKTGPLLKQIDAAISDLTAQPVEASKAPRTTLTPPSVTKAQQVSGITGELTDGQVARVEPYGTAVEPAPNRAQLDTLKRMRDEVAALGPVASYEAIRRIRSSWDQVAKVKYSPAISPDYLARQGEATGAAKGAGAMREALAAADPATAQANETYHLYRTANDVIQAAEQADRVRPNRGRGIMARTTGAMIGAESGGAVGAGIGAMVATIADKAAEMAPTFQVAIARRLAAVADALRAGDTQTAQALVDRTVARFPAVKTGLKITGKMTPAMATGESAIPLAAQDQQKRP